MNRRDTVLVLLALGALPLPSRAQLAAKPARIAFLGLSSPEVLSTAKFLAIFKQSLRELGYIEGKNLVFEARWALSKAERLPEVAREIVALNPDVIFAGAGTTARAAQQATTTIPIVFAFVDAVGLGLTKSLARPGGNLTGVSGLFVDFGPKLLELLLTVLPKLRRTAVLGNPSNPTTVTILKNLQSAARRVNVEVLSIEAQSTAEIDNAFARMSRERERAVIVLADQFFFFQVDQIAELASKSKLTSVFTSAEYVDAGGLMSYGVNLADGYRRAAVYVDKILKGAKPGDLPIEQATTLELVVNLKTAKALGLKIPRSLLLRADRVIE